MSKKKKTIKKTIIKEIIETNEKTHIISILDRSGSMANIISDSIGGFNTFLKQQKELPDDATITIVLFDDEYEVLYSNVNIKNVDLLTDKIWTPRGTTALYDAIGKTINSEKIKLNKLKDEAPDKVLVCIVTDGMENASREFRLDDIKKMIKDCENDNWNFIYLAANQDAFSVGRSFGISGGNTFTYTADIDGVKNVMDLLGQTTSLYRSMSSTSTSFQADSKNLITNDFEESDENDE